MGGVFGWQVQHLMIQTNFLNFEIVTKFWAWLEQFAELDYIFTLLWGTNLELLLEAT